MKKTNKIFTILIIINIISTLIFIIFPYKTVQTEKISAQKFPYEFEKDGTIKQQFIPQIDNMDSLGIGFATYGKKNTHGKVMIELKEQDGDIISKKEVDLSKMPDNTNIYLKFAPQENSSKKKYIVDIYFTEYFDDVRLVVWSGDAVKDNYIIKNGKKSKNSVSCSVRGKYITYNPVMYGVLILGILLISYGVKGDFKDE